MSTRVRPFGRCSRDPPLYRPQLGNLNHLCHRTALDFVPRFVHSLFALEFPPSKLQRTCLTLLRRETSQGIVYLELFNKLELFATDHIYHIPKRMF